jgi:adenylate cyclase
VGLVAVLLMSSVLSLVWLSTRMFVESDTALIQQTNADTAANLSTQMRELFQGITEKMRILGTVLFQNYQNPEMKERLVSEFFSKDKDFLGVFLKKMESSGNFSLTAQAVSPEMTNLRDPAGAKLKEAIALDKNLSLLLVASGEVQVSTVNLSDGDSAIVIAVPFMQDASDPTRFTHILIAAVRQSKFVKSFAESEIVTSFMVDRHGRVMAHPDSEIVNSHANFSNLTIVKQLLEGKFNNGQTRYVDPNNGLAKLGAFRVVGFSGLGVIAEVAEAKAFEAAKKVEIRSALIAWIILCISFLAGYLYSGTITWPIRILSEAAHKISAGDFKIDLKPRGQDEIAHLSLAFNEMAKGLEERDRVKETFNKFHNKEIAEKLLSGEVKLGGERKNATVFFSDVRGFTALSESMEPEQVVEMLNEYMTRMVSIIRSYGGVVDKYVGDAIMALWGVPLTGEDDAYRAVRACLAMREDLAKLNDIRLARGQPVLKIGMGLNTGPLIAGNIGSNEKMEYTVIGDAVNLASRIESMTKEYGTDLLVSTSVHQQIQSRFIFETGGTTYVKGKADAIVVYKVRGFIDAQGNSVIVSTPYSSYTAEKSDKVVHAASDHAPAEHVASITELSFAPQTAGSSALAPLPIAVARPVAAPSPIAAVRPAAVTMAAPIAVAAPISVAATPAPMSKPAPAERWGSAPKTAVSAAVPAIPARVPAAPTLPPATAPQTLASPVLEVAAAVSVSAPPVLEVRAAKPAAVKSKPAPSTWPGDDAYAGTGPMTKSIHKANAKTATNLTLPNLVAAPISNSLAPPIAQPVSVAEVAAPVALETVLHAQPVVARPALPTGERTQRIVMTQPPPQPPGFPPSPPKKPPPRKS